MSSRVSSHHSSVEHSKSGARGGSDRACHSRQTAERGGRGYTIAHGSRQLQFGPIAFWTVVAGLVAMALWSAGTATYFAFRDDLLTRLIARQADMQYAYEDRIAELRSQIDRITSRQLLDQEQVEQRIEQLGRRQSTLEARTSALSGLPDPQPTAAIKPGLRLPSATERAATPKPSPINDTGAPARERQSSFGLRTFASAAPAASGPLNVRAMLAEIEESLDRIESFQSAALLAMEDRYDAKSRRMRAVLAELGLDTRKLAPAASPSGLGGPFVPVVARADAGAFERQLSRVQIARAGVDRLVRVLAAVPLRKPLAGEIDTSSGFGVRLDPFLRAPAMHSGLDFRAAHGEPARATAAGTVVSAGWNGGYGQMVEIDHGNGFSTRYAHLSQVLVKEDQVVRPGQIVGRVGSTGRSTGPHLHYETRVDGDAVDPHRFLRAGLRLGEKL